jgi:hypothetical protein
MSPLLARAERVCRRVYKEAQLFFRQYEGQYRYRGFGILQGPPLVRRPFLFIALQPGLSHIDVVQGIDDRHEKEWPKVCANATGPWEIAKKLQKMFGPSFLHECVGINAIFLRSKDTKEYKENFDIDERNRIEEFCLPRVNRIIEAIEPQHLAFIGLRTQELFGNRWRSDLKDASGQDLTRVGKIAGKPGIAMRHLTGSWSRPTDADLHRIRDRVLAMQHEGRNSEAYSANPR